MEDLAHVLGPVGFGVAAGTQQPSQIPAVPPGTPEAALGQAQKSWGELGTE